MRIEHDIMEPMTCRRQTSASRALHGACTSRRRAFTLIELLIVIAIIGIVAALTLAVAGTVFGQTKERATKVVLDQIQSAINARIDLFLKETQTGLNIAPYQLMAGGPSPGTGQAELNSVIGQRATVIARLDSMRSAFPQDFDEFIPSVGTIPTPGLVTLMNATNQNPVSTPEAMYNALLAFIKDTQVEEHGTATAPSFNPYPTHSRLLLNYLIAAGWVQNQQDFDAKGGITWAANQSTAVPNRGNHTKDTESSECLYLILKDNVTGEDVLDSIPRRFIKDTDEDGLMEIVDAWGKPIRFYRWATDTYAYFIEVTKQMPSTNVGNSLDPRGLLYPIKPDAVNNPAFYYQPDPNGFWAATNYRANEFMDMVFARMHPAYQPPVLSGSPPGTPVSDLRINANQQTGRNEALQNVSKQYPFRPLLVSAGSDGEMGLYSANTLVQRADGNNFSIQPQSQELFVGIRCGRVEEEPEREGKFRDNIFSIELQEGIKR